jgi:hypothetical protein
LRFDALHENYSRLTMVIFWLGAASLGAFAARVSSNSQRPESLESRS